MLRHVVLLRWQPEVDEAARRAVCDALAAMPAAVPEIRDLRWGPNVGTSPNAFDLAVVMDFDDREAFARYLASAAHRAYVEGPGRAAVGAIAAVQHVL